MRRITTLVLATAALCVAAVALATPVPNSAVITTRIFDDCPVTTLTTNNAFPGLVAISDQNLSGLQCGGFANLHAWHFSTDGVNKLQFLNEDTFEWSCTFQANGKGEGGLNMGPWWATPGTDGYLNVRTTDGEVACFGGRLPFYSFTGNHGVIYANNTPIDIGISYFPNGLSAALPGYIIYNVRYNAINFSSGPLNFDQGNAAEDPPHGLWGALTPWYGGGAMKMFVNQPVGVPQGLDCSWSQIQFTAGPTPGKKSSWGQLKKLYR